MAGGYGGGVTNGDRTRDFQGHNLTLYRLSYGHHESVDTTRRDKRTLSAMRTELEGVGP